MRRRIKNIDLFGYPIHLKFEKNEGPKYKTLVGAFMSIVFMVLSIGVVYLVFSPQTEKSDINKNDDSIIVENLRMDQMFVDIFGVLNKDLIDKIGSVGGTIFLLYTVFEYAVNSYSRVSFRNRLLKRLYFARVVNKPNKLF